MKPGTPSKIGTIHPAPWSPAAARGLTGAPPAISPSAPPAFTSRSAPPAFRVTPSPRPVPGSAAGALAQFGKVLNEALTEELAQRVCLGTGIHVTDNYYSSERALLGQIGTVLHWDLDIQPWLPGSPPRWTPTTAAS